MEIQFGVLSGLEFYFCRQQLVGALLEFRGDVLPRFLGCLLEQRVAFDRELFGDLLVELAGRSLHRLTL